MIKNKVTREKREKKYATGGYYRCPQEEKARRGGAVSGEHKGGTA